jgi:preprotein translocase subunit SecD
MGQLFTIVFSLNPWLNHLHRLLNKIYRRYTVAASAPYRATIFITTLVLVGILSLIFSAKALADLVLRPLPAAGISTQVILRPVTATGQTVDVAATRLVVARRLQQLNLFGAYILADQAGQLAVTLPATDQTPYVLDLITQVGQIEFIDGGQTPPLGRQAQTGEKYEILFTGQEISDMVPPDAINGQIFYRLRLTPAATQRLTRFAEAETGHYICMVLDKQVVNCSGMYHLEGNGNTLDILPNLTTGAAVSLNELAVFIESGPLPAPLKIQSTNSAN